MPTIPSPNYVYVLTDPRDDIPFYIGKGTLYRFKAHESEARNNNDTINRAKCDFIREIWESGQNIKYELLACDDEMGAFTLEQQLIEKYGRRINNTGTLFNVDRGGRDRWRPKTSNKQVYVYDFTGELKHTFPTTRKAAEFFGCDPSVISSRTRRAKTFRDVWVLSYSEMTPDDVSNAMESNRPAKRKVEQCDDQWNVVAEFDSTYEAGRSIGKRDDTIYSTIREFSLGKRKSPRCGGFLWRFA